MGPVFWGGVFRFVSEKYSIRLLNLKYRSYLISFLLIISVFLLNIRNEIPCISENVSFALQALGGAILVWLVFIDEFRVLSCKWLVMFGNISYEFYLIHFVFLLYFRSFYIDTFFYLFISFISSLLCAKLLSDICGSILTKLKNEHSS